MPKEIEGVIKNLPIKKQMDKQTIKKQDKRVLIQNSTRILEN